MRDLREAIIETLTGVNLAEVRKGMTDLKEQVTQRDNSLELFEERMAELELALEDANWMRLMAGGQQEFSREGLRKITELARMMYLKNPLVNRGVSIKALYVWAQGVSIRAKDKQINKILQDFWDDEKNRAELTGHQARMLKEVDLEVEGNIFFVFFTRPSDGRVRVRSVSTDEIVQIICDPQDAKSPWLYLRQWTEQTLNPATGRTNNVPRKAYYPDWKYNPVKRAPKFGNVPVMWDAPVYHVKTGAFSSWKFGLSEVYAAIDWARAYKEFLEDWASLTRSYSRFAFKMTTVGGKKGVAAAKAKMNSTLGNAGTNAETNPPTAAGGVFIGGEGVDLNPMQLRGANVSAEDGRRLLLMVASSVGLPETYFGDVSVGTLATAKSMDRPTELAMRERQTFWADILKNIFLFVIKQAIEAGQLSDLATLVEQPDGGEIESIVVWGAGVDAHIDIDFPPMLERDVQAAVQAIVTAATLNGQPIAMFDEPTVARLLLTALAQDDVDEIMTELYPDETASIDSGATPSEARVNVAVAKLAEAIRKVVKNG